MEQSILEPGVVAPDFKLKATPDQLVSLAELRGRPIVLVFYPADWSPVCSDQLAVYNSILDEFRAYDALVIAISVDGAWSHLAFARDRKLQFPLLADFEPKGEVARAYGAYDRKEGVAARALFVLDRDGVIAWSYLSPIGVNPGADGILEALARLEPARRGTATGAAGEESRAGAGAGEVHP
ncbi:MAG TPA: redoxin domain-containing protein [Polyangia bacterium]|nr:redoxin domain-containing protein [Polyangia bacterium]